MRTVSKHTQHSYCIKTVCEKWQAKHKSFCLWHCQLWEAASLCSTHSLLLPTHRNLVPPDVISSLRLRTNEPTVEWTMLMLNTKRKTCGFCNEIWSQYRITVQIIRYKYQMLFSVIFHVLLSNISNILILVSDRLADNWAGLGSTDREALSSRLNLQGQICYCLRKKSNKSRLWMCCEQQEQEWGHQFMSLHTCIWDTYTHLCRSLSLSTLDFVVCNNNKVFH